MENKPSFRYHQIRPTRSVTGTGNFNGEIQFEFASTSDVRIDLNNAYMDLRCDVTKSTAWILGATNNVQANNQGICQNPYSALFKSKTLFINDVEVSQSNQFSVESTIMKMTLSNNDEATVSDCSPVVPVQFSTDDYNADLVTNGSVITKAGAAVIRNSKNIATKKILDQVYPELDSDDVAPPTADVLSLKLSHPLAPLFIQSNPDEALYASKIKLTVQVDPDYLTKLFHSAGGETLTVFNLTAFNLNIPTYESVIGPPLGISYSTKYMACHSSVRNLNQSSTDYQISLPSSSIKYVMLAFARSAVGPLTDNNSYESAFTVAGDALSTMYVNFANRTYPSPQYSFPADRLRAYQDYVHMSASHQMATAPLLSFKEWMQTPVFCFVVLPTPGNTSNLLDVSITGNATNANSVNVLTTCWYDKELAIQYGEAGQVESTSVRFLNE